MDRDQQVAENIKNQLKANKRWLIASLVAGLWPFSFYFFQDFIPGFIFLNSSIVAVILILVLPIAVCLVGVIKLYQWWKLVPIAMLIFNAVLIFLLIALIAWSKSGHLYW